MSVVNLMLSLPTVDGWYDKLLVYESNRGTDVYLLHTRLGSRPLSQAALDALLITRAGSLHPIDVAARKEQRGGTR